MTISDEGPFAATLTSSAAPEDRLTVIGVDGEERLGNLFRYELIFVREAGAFSEGQLDEQLTAVVSLGLGAGKGGTLHGRLSEIEEIGLGRGPQGHGDLPLYRATMVPTVWLLTRSRHSRVYMQMSVEQLLREILSTYGLRESVDFDIRVSGGVIREQITQYRESDWDFVRRWMEHEGYWFWFDHSGGADRLVIADSNADSADLSDPRRLVHGSGTAEESVWGFGRARLRGPARVAVIDGRKGMSQLQIVRTEVRTPGAFGTAVFDDFHTEDADHAVHLAEVQSQAAKCACELRWGATDSARFRPGLRFELAQHPTPANDGTFLIVEARLSVGAQLGTDRRITSEARPLTTHFAAIPLDVAYRSLRVTPWPTIPGVIRAALAAPHQPGNGHTMLRDALGRYLVRLPFDAISRTADRAFVWAHAGVPLGPDAGMMVGDDLLVAFVEGDPDRPIVVGRTSPVDARGLSAESGIRVEIEKL